MPTRVENSVLTLNAGSSSLKFAVFDGAGDAPRQVVRGAISDIGGSPRFQAAGADGQPIEDRRVPSGTAVDHEELLRDLLEWLERHRGTGALLAAGHRVVHGGTEFSEPVKISAQVLAQLEALDPLAPLHQPHNLTAIRALAAVRPELPQVASFDTAFHRSLAPEAYRFALPAALEAEGVRRYGFHGLSYDYIAGRLAALAPDAAAGRVIAAHLGAGASLCAMRDGKSVDTTMGFSALDGLPMATRCGALDPGVLLYLLRKGLDADRIETMLYRESGLLAVSGVTGDMRKLLASDDPRAAAAVELFVFRVAREIGALAATLGGLDVLAFTAGIGENAPPIRERVCARLGWLGVRLDADANAAGHLRISAPGSRVTAWAIPTDEELVIARNTLAVAGRAGQAAR